MKACIDQIREWFWENIPSVKDTAIMKGRPGKIDFNIDMQDVASVLGVGNFKWNMEYKLLRDQPQKNIDEILRKIKSL